MGDLGSIPGLGSSLGEGNGNPLQYSHLENPMDRGAWQITVHGTARSNQSILREISPEYSLEVEAPILGSPDVKNRLIGKDPDAGKD